MPTLLRSSCESTGFATIDITWTGPASLRVVVDTPSLEWTLSTLMPSRMYFVQESTATLDGTHLGRPIRLDTNPTIGTVPLPARGILAIGQGVWNILDPAEYERTKREIGSSALADA